MIHDAFLWLLAMFVIDPVMAEFNGRLREARAPQAVIEQVQACATAAPLALAERAAGDVWWGVSTVFSVAIGMTDPKAVIAQATPGCAAAVAAVRPLLAGGGS
jgi:hypothetical protein